MGRKKADEEAFLREWTAFLAQEETPAWPGLHRQRRPNCEVK
jgi:hypothetical protein